MNETTRRLHLRQLAFGLQAGVLGAAPHRMAIWTYGCDLGCPACSSAQTWQADSAADAHWVPIQAILALAVEHGVNGLVISGGEPTLQAPAVTELARGFKRIFPDKEVVLYTGLRFEPLSARFPALVESVDVAVTGPYIEALPPTPLAGSSNQRVNLLTPLAKRPFNGWESWPLHHLQIAAEIPTNNGQTEIVTVGIPHTQRLEKALQGVPPPVQQESVGRQAAPVNKPGARDGCNHES